MKITVIAIVACMTFGIATAQSKKATPTVAQKNKTPPTTQQQPAQYLWDKEPSTVFGIKLGEKIPEGSIPTCNLPSSANDYKLPDALCLERSSPLLDSKRYQELWGVPLSPVASLATVVLQENMVESIIIEMRHEVFNQMHVILVERYGLPTKTDNETVTTKTGAKFSSKTLIWSGVANSVFLYERSGKIDKSLAIFSNNALTDATDKKNADSLKGAASKL